MEAPNEDIEAGDEKSSLGKDEMDTGCDSKNKTPATTTKKKTSLGKRKKSAKQKNTTAKKPVATNPTTATKKVTTTKKKTSLGKRKKSEGYPDDGLDEFDSVMSEPRTKIQKVIHPIEPNEADFREAVEWLKLFERNFHKKFNFNSKFCEKFISVVEHFFQVKDKDKISAEDIQEQRLKFPWKLMKRYFLLALKKLWNQKGT